MDKYYSCCMDKCLFWRNTLKFTALLKIKISKEGFPSGAIKQPFLFLQKNPVNISLKIHFI